VDKTLTWRLKSDTFNPVPIYFKEKFRRADNEGFFKNPFFYFGFITFVLFCLLFLNSDSLAKLDYVKVSSASFFKGASNLVNSDLFFSQNKALALETPDLKIIQDNFLYGISTPRVLTTQTLGDIFGESSQNKKEVVDYSVQPGDTIESIANAFNISSDTLIWANDLSRAAALKVGQTLVVPPVSGVIYVVKPQDTISDISKTYKAKADDIITFNNLSGEGDIFIGDILMIPGGIMPSKALPFVQTQLADNFFIYPAEGQISQGFHYYNAVDLANKCGTSIYAAAAGTVQRAVSNGGWNFGMGNYITILHSGGIATYYGHLLALFVRPQDHVNVGDRIALMGQTGNATGCHVHFQVMGARNPLAKYLVGTALRYR